LCVNWVLASSARVSGIAYDYRVVQVKYSSKTKCRRGIDAFLFKINTLLPDAARTKAPRQYGKRTQSRSLEKTTKMIFSFHAAFFYSGNLSDPRSSGGQVSGVVVSSVLQYYYYYCKSNIAANTL